MKTFIGSVTKSWTSIINAVKNDNEKYANPDVYRISPVLLTSHNNIYISTNIEKNATVIVEFPMSFLADKEFPKAVGVDIQVKQFNEIDPNKKYIEIIKKEECDIELFIAFSISLVEKTSYSKSDAGTLKGLIDVLKKYSTMFQKISKNLADQMEQGLFCELLYLEHLIDTKGDECVLNWAGPEENKHDFVFDNYATEIKSTLNTKQVIVKISSENQLCRFDFDKLYLAVYQIEESPAGEFIHETIERIANKISNSDCYIRFLMCLNMYGIDPGNYIGEKKYKVFAQHKYDVDESFPKISRDEIPAEVYEVKYSLNLSNIKELNEEECQI